MAQVSFGAADYAVFSLTLLISASIGIYYRFTGGRQKTAVVSTSLIDASGLIDCSDSLCCNVHSNLLFQEYLLADRSMGIIPVAFSLMASFMSAITLLGVSAENYSFGTMFVAINLSYGIFTPVAAYLFLPVFFNLGATSVYEVSKYGSYFCILLIFLLISISLVLIFYFILKSI